MVRIFLGDQAPWRGGLLRCRVMEEALKQVGFKDSELDYCLHNVDAPWLQDRESKEKIDPEVMVESGVRWKCGNKSPNYFSTATQILSPRKREVREGLNALLTHFGGCKALQLMSLSHGLISIRETYFWAFWMRR